ncbi:MAG: phosphatidylinositol-specific phospholipase C [Pseudonocardiaceae bacterium]
MGDFILHTSWMRDIPDGATVTMLSIPGTHNSCCIDGPLGLAKAQDLDLPDQLDAGIRFLDIRLAHYHDDLFAHHDVVCTGKSYADVLAVCSEFLGRYPSETILMSVDEESRFDGALGRFAPSQLLGKLSTGSAEFWGENTRSFEDTFRSRTWEQVGDVSLFYNFATAPSGGDTGVFTAGTELGEVRGKIVLLRRFESGEDVGLDLTYWPENQRFRSAAPPFYNIEDRYQNPGEDDKLDFVVAHIEEAMRGDPKDLYVTFSSAVDLTARGYAEMINPRLNDYLAGCPQGRVGIIVMDHFEEPRELVSNVIKMNASVGFDRRAGG